MDETTPPIEDDKLPITDHLEELRWRLIKCVVAVIVGFVGTYAFARQIFNFLVAPLVKVMPAEGQLIYTSLPEAFITYLKVSFFAGLILATPVILYQLWKFIMPGLYEHERRYVIPFVIVATFFFLVGVLFAYYVVFPFGFAFFLGFATEDISALPSLKEYLNLATRMLLAFGVTFELPVVMFFLGKIGIVNHKMLAKQRKYAILIVVILASILTPPDVISQILLAIPLLGLYEVSIWVVWGIDKRRGEVIEEDTEESADEE